MKTKTNGSFVSQICVHFCHFYLLCTFFVCHSLIDFRNYSPYQQHITVRRVPKASYTPCNSLSPQFVITSCRQVQEFQKAWAVGTLGQHVQFECKTYVYDYHFFCNAKIYIFESLYLKSMSCDASAGS